MIVHITRIRSFKFYTKILVNEVFLHGGSGSTTLRLCLEIERAITQRISSSLMLHLNSALCQKKKNMAKINTSIGVSGSSGSNFCWSTLTICSQHSLASWGNQACKRSVTDSSAKNIDEGYCLFTCCRYCPWSPFSANCGKAMWRNCSRIMGGRLDEVLSMVSYKSRRADDAKKNKKQFTMRLNASLGGKCVHFGLA